jgi:hypothetical protein
MTARRTLSASLAVLALLLLHWPATANVPESFTACIGPVQSDYCSTDDTYLAGDDLWLRGKVKPAHAGMIATVQTKEPGEDVWQGVATDTISDAGKMRWTWATDVSDARTKPYRLRWKIPGHGTSEVVKVLLIVPGT